MCIRDRCNTISTLQSQHSQDLNEIKGLLNRLACNSDMDSVDLQPFFPVTDNETILRFMSDSDGQYEKRRKAFESFLYSIVSSNPTNKRLFSDALFHNVFARNYIVRHLRPCKGYKEII